MGSARNVLGELTTNIYASPHIVDGGDGNRITIYSDAHQNNRPSQRMFLSAYDASNNGNRPVYTVRPGASSFISNLPGQPGNQQIPGAVGQDRQTIYAPLPGATVPQDRRGMVSADGLSVVSVELRQEPYQRDSLYVPQPSFVQSRGLTHLQSQPQTISHSITQPHQQALRQVGDYRPAAGRQERSSWHNYQSNNGNWAQTDNINIRKTDVNNGRLQVRTRDDELEDEFSYEKWRHQSQQPSNPQPNFEAARSQYIDASPQTTSMSKPLGSVQEATNRQPYPQPQPQMSQSQIQTRLPMQQDQAPFTPDRSISRAPDSVSASQGNLTPVSRQPPTPSRQPPQASQPAASRILNSDDLKSLVAGDNDSMHSDNMTVIGKTAYGQKIYGFDASGQPVVSFDKEVNKPVYGYTLDSKLPVYGFSSLRKALHSL